jgi:DNA-binding ferritin-like protein (Dps family)
MLVGTSYFLNENIIAIDWFQACMLKLGIIGIKHTLLLKLDFKTSWYAQYKELKMKESNKLASVLKMMTFTHRGQTRKFDGEAYICHLLEVVNILQHFDIHDEDTLIAGILHDVIEDAFSNRNMLSELFGGDVANIIQELTVDKTLHQDLRNKKAQEPAGILSKPAVNIKFADLLSNMMAIHTYWDESALEKYLKKCSKLVDIIETKNIEACPTLLQLLKYALDSQITGSVFFFGFYENADKRALNCSISRQRFLVINNNDTTPKIGNEFDKQRNDLFQCELWHSLRLTGKTCKSIRVAEVFSEQSEDYAFIHSEVINDCVQVTVLTKDSVSKQGESA